ncbi:hypothetical protein [Thiorhodococcus mannitoliphagus]|uniref:hypothetical protein n=1 Tax=Thiorhodococcus mannitoliphagus TaxID=329406 RepID=UPI00197E0FB8|nr:hypothetical protein [Thiorhodococcus mannitoliphagus]
MRKKLIEVSLPLDAINKASAREKSDPSLAAGAIAPDPLNILIRFEPLPCGGCFFIQAHWRGE